MTIQVLLSCMHQDNLSIIERTNIQSDAIIINQCDIDEYSSLQRTNNAGEKITIQCISSTARGLSKSRNQAIKTASADVCLLCDDDEILSDDYATIIAKAFEENADTGIIAFKIENSGQTYMKGRRKIGYLGALRLASYQLAFRRNSIVDSGISFDESLGSGVSKAGGEENKFLYDCLNKRIKILYLPISIGRMIESESQWFHGYSQEYFYDRGIFTRKIMGPFWASMYGLYFIVRKRKRYKKDISMKKAASALCKGIHKR